MDYYMVWNERQKASQYEWLADYYRNLDSELSSSYAAMSREILDKILASEYGLYDPLAAPISPSDSYSAASAVSPSQAAAYFPHALPGLEGVQPAHSSAGMFAETFPIGRIPGQFAHPYGQQHLPFPGLTASFPQGYAVTSNWVDYSAANAGDAYRSAELAPSIRPEYAAALAWANASEAGAHAAFGSSALLSASEANPPGELFQAVANSEQAPSVQNSVSFYPAPMGRAKKEASPDSDPEASAYALVRLLHAAPGQPQLALTLEGAPAALEADYLAASPYAAVLRGKHTIRLVSFKDDEKEEDRKDREPFEFELKFKGGGRYTVAAAPSEKDGGTQLLVFDDEEENREDRTKVRLLNLAREGPVDVMMRDGGTLFRKVAAGSSSPYITLSPVELRLELTEAGSLRLLHASEPLLFPAASSLTLVYAGSPPKLLLLSDR